MKPSSDQTLPALVRLAEGSAVLYVEDEPGIRTEIAEMLQSLFTRVVTADNGAKALELFQQETFVVVVTDINMPIMTGIELIQAIRQRNPTQAVVVTSAYSDSDNLIPLINLGVGSFVLKPVNWRMLVSLLYKEVSSALSIRQEALYQQRLQREVQLRTDELRDSQQQVVRLQEAKNNMLGLISHELRTPLNGILGFLELIRGTTLDADGQIFLDHVEDSARRLERSTRKALDFTSLSTGDRQLHREHHRIEDLVTAAYEQVVAHLEGDNTLGCAWTGGRHGELFTDSELVVEVLRNLFENVVKYAGPSPQVVLDYRREGNWNLLSFRDRGPGFPTALLDSLFQPFSTGNLMHHSEGMGLGLALVDVIMLTLGGRVEALNHAPGGAEVRLRFPLVKTAG